MRALLVIAMFSAGCKDDSPCTKAVHRVFELTASPDGKSKPSAEEQKVIDEIETMSVGKCKDEGLSQAQADCLLAMKTFDDLKNVWKCPAIAAKHPSWLLSGPMPDEPPPK